jgi:hemolysin activation/secretion protein
LGASVGGTSVVGSGSIYGARLIKPLDSTESLLHSATLGFDYKDFDQAILLAGQDSGRTPIEYASFMAGYDASWRREKSFTSLGVATHFSIRGLGNDQRQFDDENHFHSGKRLGSRANFLYLSGDFKHQQNLPEDLRLVARASAQLADSPLISNEQFAVGGPLSVRGYHQTQQLGDRGLNLSLELHSPKLFSGSLESLQNLRALSFVDWAYLWILQPQAQTPSYYQLASAGLGLRMQIFQHVVGELDWAYPFYRQSTVDAGQQRVDFRLAYEY